MNQELQQALADFINKSVAATEKAAEFVLSEIPDVLHQLLLWHSVKSLAASLFGVSVMAITLVLVYKAIRNAIEKGSDDVWFITSMGCIFALFPFIFGCFMFNLTWLQIWIAPKVWIIEYAANLVK